MFCKNCGRKIRDDASFCPYCGKKVHRSVTTRKPAGGKKRKNRRVTAVILIVLIVMGACGTAWVRYGWYLTAKRDWAEESKTLSGGIIYPMRDTTGGMTYALLNEFSPDLTVLEEEYFFSVEEGLMAGRHSGLFQSVSCSSSGTEDNEEVEKIFRNVICSEENGKITYLKVGNISADYSYDQKGRVQKRTYHYKSEVSIIEQYRYDSAGHVTEHSYYEQENGKDKIVVTRQRMAYDSHGNRTELKEYLSEDEQDLAASSTASYQYKGKTLTGATVFKNENGSKEKYQAKYNKSGQMTKLTGKSDSGTKTIEIEYKKGYPVLYRYSSDDDDMGKDYTEESYSYRNGYRATLKDKTVISEDSWEIYNVNYDELGRIIRKEEGNNFGLMGFTHSEDYSSDSAQTVTTYSYDDDGRLTGMKYQDNQRTGSDISVIVSFQYA